MSSNPFDDGPPPRDPMAPPRVDTIDETTDEAALPDDLDDGNESDEDPSVVGDVGEDLLEGASGSLDTARITLTDRAGEFPATASMCRVILSSRTPEGQLLFCGNTAIGCTRRAHLTKQMDGSKRAEPGVYEGVLNVSKKVADGLLSSHIPFEEREEKAKANLQAIEESIYRSAQKKQAEIELAPKTPSIITFNLSDQPPSSISSRREQMRAWRDSADEETPSVPLPRPSVMKPTASAGIEDTSVKPSATASLEPSEPVPDVSKASRPKPRDLYSSRQPGSPSKTVSPSDLKDDEDRLAATLGRLTKAMTNKLDEWQVQQVQLNRTLIAEVKKASRPATRTTESTVPDIPLRQPESDTRPPGRIQSPHNQDTIPPMVNITEDRHPRRAQRYYAVVKGRTLGIMD
jgi:hypothetical protein